MGRKLNLGHLSEDECEKILQVIQRDFELRQKEKERLGKIEEEISTEDSKVAILAKSEKFNENCCMRCFSKFFFIFNQKVQCITCGYFVCKNCAIYKETDKNYVCNVCEKQLVLTVQACDWFYTNVKKKFKRFGSAKVVRSLYKRKTDSESDIDSGYDPSLHSNSLPVGKRSRPNIEEIIKHRSPRGSGIQAAGSVSDGNANCTHSPSTATRTCNAAYSREVAARLESFDAVASKEIERFKHQLNNTVDDLHHILENQAPPGSPLSKHSSAEFDHLMDSQRHHLMVALTNLSQSLHLAIDHETLAEPLSSATKHHYVRHLITKQIEDYVGDSIGPAEDETSEYASEDGSTSEHSTVFEDSLADAIITKVFRDYEQAEVQRHLEEEHDVRRDLTALSNQCTITQLHDELSTYTESETDEPHSSTQTSINIETDVESHFSDMRDSDSMTSETCFDKQIDSEVEYSVHQSDVNMPLTKSESTDTLMSDDFDLDQLVLNNSEVALRTHLTPSPDGTMSRSERDVEVSQMTEGLSQSVPVNREYSEQVSSSESSDVGSYSITAAADESPLRAQLSTDLALPGNVFEDDEDEPHEMAFEFLQSHKPSLPNFGEEDEPEQQDVVDLDDISQISRLGLTINLENHDDDDNLDVVDAENNPEITRSRSPRSPSSTTLESEIMFGSAWNTKQKGSHLFKNQNVITPYDNFGEKKVGKDSSGPVYMFIPKEDEPMSPRIGEKEVEELSDLSSVRSSEEDDLSLPGSDEEEQEEVAQINDDVVYSKHQEELASQEEIEAVVEKVTMTTAAAKRVHFAKNDESLSNALSPRKSVDLPAEEFSKLVAVAMSQKLDADDEEDEDSVDPEDADPRFILRPKSQTVPIGDTAKFICQVAGSEPLDVFWYRDMVEVQQIEDTEHYELQHKQDGKFILEVFNTTMEDAGQYLCIAVNDNGQAHKSMKLKLTKNDNERTSPEFLKGLQDVETVEGQTVKFRCKIRGYPQPRVLWYKDGKRIHNSEKATVEKIGNRDYMLTLESVTLEDDAEYVVIARNASGEARSTAQLLVEACGDQDDDHVFDANRPLPANLTGASDALYPETDELLRIAEQVHAARNKVTATAEDVLESADHVNSLNRQLDEMDRALGNLEDNVNAEQGATYDSLFYDSENNNDDLLSDSLRASILEHTDMKKRRGKSAARNIRSMTSSALQVLSSTQQVIQSEQPDFTDSGDLMSFDEEQTAAGQKADYVESVSSSEEREQHIIPKLQLEEEKEEEFHLSFAEFEVLYRMGVITREQMRKGKVHPRDLQRIQRALDEYYAEQMEECDVSHDLRVDDFPAAIDCGLKRVDSKRYKRDYVINRNSPQPNRKKWEVQEPWAFPVAAEVVKATPAGEREQVSLDETEEEENIRLCIGAPMLHQVPLGGSKSTIRKKHNKSEQLLIQFDDEDKEEEGADDVDEEKKEENIYMAAGKVFSLEDRIKLLEEKVANADESPESLARLEDEVARYAAKVKHSEDKVLEVERHVDILQEHYSAAQSSQSVAGQSESAELSINSQSEDEKLPSAEGGSSAPSILLRGISSEEDVPESRTECDEELSLPSVKSLMTKFNTEDNGSIRRVHSLTGRDLPPTVREKLRRQSPAIVPNTNVRTNAQSKRPDIMSLFEVSEMRDESLSTRKADPPRSSTPLFNSSEQGRRITKDHSQSYLDQSSIMASPTHKQSRSLDSSQAASPHAPIKKQNSNSSLQRQPIRAVHASATSNTSAVQLRSTGSINTSQVSSSAPKKNHNSAIMARAAFWDTRINEGKVNDRDELESFPEMPQYSFKSTDES